MDEATRKELLAILPRLRRFARGLAHNSDEADDLVQMACERAIRNIVQWQPGTRLDSWMYRIIQTAWTDLVRARRVRHGYAEATAATASVATGGESAAIDRLTLQAVRCAIQRLPEAQREVLLLVCVEQIGRAHV